MALRHIDKKEFDSLVLNSDGKVLVDFYADWCGPCRMLAPVLEDIANENDGVEIYKVNVDNEEELAVKYGIMSIPALIVFDKGEIVNRSVGLISKQELLDLLK